MAFTQFKLDIATEQTRGIFNTYVYESDTDTIEDVNAEGYFSASRFPLIDSDGCSALVRCCCSDGFFEGFMSEGGTIEPSNGEIKVEVSSDYTVNGWEEVIISLAALTLTWPSTGSHTVRVIAETGTTELMGGITDTLTVGQSQDYTPYTGGWVKS